MKLSTTLAAALAVLSLSACNTQPAANNTADNAAANATLDEVPVDGNAAEATGNDAKPTDGAIGNEAAAPAGDKPVEATTEASSSDEPAPDKPTE